jgi:exodeoxyribonuclease-3
MQVVRAPDDMVHGLVHEIAGRGWHVVHDESTAKGRAGVAVAARRPIAGARFGLPDLPDGCDGSGRWCEADLEVDGPLLTVVSAYVHTGDAESPTRMTEKLAFLEAAGRRLDALRAAGRRVLLTGDLNVAHREVDIKNWKGNLRRAGFLPEERAWFDRLYGRGWVDVGRVLGGDGPGPYTWWSWRGKAFDTDAGWRIDYQIADPTLAATAVSATVDRAPSYAERWSDHAPLVVRYRL